MISGLDSASRKIDRAMEHFDAINRAIAGITSKPGSYEIIQETDGKETVNFLVDPPADIAILAGEIVYQLRSALDHLAFELVKFNPGGITLPVDWEKRCDFPLLLKIPDEQIRCGHVTPPLPYNCFTRTLPGISRTAFAFIEGVQPYNSGPGIHNVMRIIAQLSNIDRHRYLNPTLSRVAVHQQVEFASGNRSSLTIGGLMQDAEIKPFNVEIDGPDKAVDVKRTFSPYVTFDEITIGAGPATLEIQNVLEVCLEQVKRGILPAFIQLLKNP